MGLPIKRQSSSNAPNRYYDVRNVVISCSAIFWYRCLQRPTQRGGGAELGGGWCDAALPVLASEHRAATLIPVDSGTALRLARSRCVPVYIP
jgi:hypothetical protein